jgi:hypothetical protein
MILLHTPLHLTPQAPMLLKPFAIDDAAKSILLQVSRDDWPQQPSGQSRTVLDVTLDISLNGGRDWVAAGGFGAAGGTILDRGRLARHNYLRVGLHPARSRIGRVTLRSARPLRTVLHVENSITVGTPGSATGFADTGSVAVDAGSGTDRVMFAFQLRSARTPFDTFTYNALGMTLIGQAGSIPYATAYKYVAPATGSHTLAFDHSSQGSANFLLVGVPTDGVDQTTPNDAAVTATGTASSAATLNVSSATGDLVLDGVCFDTLGSPNDCLVGAGQTVIVKQDTVGSTNVACGTSQENGAGTVTMSWTGDSGTPNWAQIGFNVNAATAGGTAALSGSASTGGHGTSVPNFAIPL